MPHFSPKAGGFFFVGGRENEEESSDGRQLEVQKYGCRKIAHRARQFGRGTWWWHQSNQNPCDNNVKEKRQHTTPPHHTPPTGIPKNDGTGTHVRCCNPTQAQVRSNFRHVQVPCTTGTHVVQYPEGCTYVPDKINFILSPHKC